MQPMTPQQQTFTYWRNPTADVVIADVSVGPSAGPTGKIRYRWEPGEVISVPSEYDKEIRDDRGAGIILGLAPQLEQTDGAGFAEWQRSKQPAAPAPAQPQVRPRNRPPEQE